MVVPHQLFIFFHLLLLSKSHARPQTFVDIRNDLPKNTKAQLELSCNKGSYFHLKLGDHLNSSLTVDQDFECTAAWSRWFTTWDAYHAERDKDHHTVYWSVRKDGFYHTWDGSKWNLLEHWYTE
ncbi:hypothetical protein VNO78_04053 [Psophocarpus tetragonolobus]|uniref:S-protein homolog n=1 Tax=Psophocarpus tetragonolobus TaxID=3891 RepID=A0AAN9TFK8_PSOTE